MFSRLSKEIGGLSGMKKIFYLVLQDVLPKYLRHKLSFYNQSNLRLSSFINVRELTKKRIHPYALNKFNDYSHTSISSYQLFKDPLPRYLKWEDRNSMAHSVEARVPFLDYRLVEFVHSLPLDYLDAPDVSKRILVEAMEGILPEKVRNRKDKKGFITPEQRWFLMDYKDDFIDYFRKNVEFAKGIINREKAEKYLLNMQKGIIPFGYSYWRIILFCVWMKVFNVDIE
jgi:asparagine synthase (glutamine-hydrolysing)